LRKKNLKKNLKLFLMLERKKFNNNFYLTLAGVMVIIKRDDYISFLNSTGVKIMPTTPVNTNEIIPGNGNLIPANNNNNNNGNASNIATIKRDNSQQQLQQLQAYTNQQQQQLQNQQQQQNQNNQNLVYAKAQLICRPNSHPFPVSNCHTMLIIKYKNKFSLFRVAHSFLSQRKL
jgi:hypothetical protein